MKSITTSEFDQTTMRCRLLVRGVVQGVGFRPFVYRTAVGLGLAGNVRNTPEGVVVEVEGDVSSIRGFVRALREDAPPLARVESIREAWIDPIGQKGFEIAVSRGQGSATLIPPDVATCDACLKELFDPSDRRFRYPFINCTDCGPRFTIIAGLPYDRSSTTMSRFRMCPDCQAEYDDPSSRRFHAEPNACPRCGPRVWLAGRGGEEELCDDPILETASRLHEGMIVAVKGLGGFHLAADATNAAAVERLRKVKQRDRKPFAVMAPDIGRVRQFAFLTGDEEQCLKTPARPIVLLARRDPSPLAGAVAPGNALVGVMLPYSPLHHLLLANGFTALVMTSANPLDEPIAKDNDEAVARLSDVADCFLMHDRPILCRADDSVAALAGGRPRLVRRSRGYTPLPVTLNVPREGPPVFACGGDMKNAFCVVRGDEAFFSQHIGDLENAETAAHFERAAEDLCRLLDVRPEVVAHDMHPDYVSSRLARRLCEGAFPGARRMEVQHHHAHVLSCLAENGSAERVLGLAIDGTGWGLDGTAWGGEILLVDGAGFERLAHLRPLPLPGGDRAVREPWRTAVAALSGFGCPALVPRLAERWPDVPEAMVRAVQGLSGVASPLSSGLGRLFDAVSAVLGVRTSSTYEGEAAVALEQASASSPTGGPYPFRVVSTSRPAVIDSVPMLKAIAHDALAGSPNSLIAARFHETVIAALVAAVLEAARATGVRSVALSGGSCQNRILLAGLVQRLENSGLKVLTQSAIPANDGGLALGQAMAAITAAL